MDRDMRRPPNLMKTMPVAEAPQAPSDPGPPTHYLDLYGLSKPPFGGAPGSGGYILFGSHRRAFELLVDHMMNGSGVVVLTGEEGVGKTETLLTAASVADQSGLRSIMVSRPPEGRISLEHLSSALDEQPEHFHLPPRKALLADDVDLMPSDCIDLLLSLARAAQDNPDGSPIVLCSSVGGLSRPELAGLASLARDTIRLPPLGPAEVRQYIERSLWVAGGTTRRLISPSALKVLTSHTGGIPGTINRVMEAALTAGFARGDRMITAKTVAAAMGPAAPRVRRRPGHREPEVSGVATNVVQIAAMLLLVAGASVFLYKGLTDRPQPAPAPARPAIVPSQAPPTQTQAEQSAPAMPAPPLAPDLMAALMKRGSEALDLGDTASARLLFQRAAEAGNGAAATALGKTYDPSFMTAANAGDPGLAADWYRKAVALGDPNAPELLKRLGSR
jgi:type II secretory pathway predicted ATPase ExeA